MATDTARPNSAFTQPLYDSSVVRVRVFVRTRLHFHKISFLLFTQLHTICVSLSKSPVTCVYASLRNKNQEIYNEPFIAIQDRCNKVVFNVDSTTPWMFLFSYSVHLEKIQNVGLAQRYREDEDFKLFCGMTDGLAYLPENDVPDGVVYLHDNIPNGLEPILHYFDGIYVSSTYHQIQLSQRSDGTIPPLCMRRKPPMYPPSM